MSKNTGRPDRIVAHVRWLQAPYVGRAAYIVERNGCYGYVPATEVDQRFSKFVPANDVDGLEKAFGVIPRVPERDS